MELTLNGRQTSVAALALPAVVATCGWTQRRAVGSGLNKWGKLFLALLRKIVVLAEGLVAKYARSNRDATLRMYKSLYEQTVYTRDAVKRVRTNPQL